MPSGTYIRTPEMKTGKHIRTPEYIRHMKESQEGKHSGEKNSMFGKRHSKETIEKIKIKCKASALRGNKSPVYKGGPIIIEEQVRRSSKYSDWRVQVFKHNNFTCQICRKEGGELNAHHIKSFRVLLQEALKYLSSLGPFEAAMQYTPLWSTNNGITLCGGCHKALHTKSKTKSPLLS